MSYKREVLIIIQALKKHLHNLESTITSLTHQLNALPQGTLYLKHDGKYIKHYLYNNHTEHYIPRKNIDLAKQLAYKEYLIAQIKDLTQEKKALELFFAKLPKLSYTESLLNNPDISSLIQFHNTTLSEDLYTWATAKYNRNTKHLENLIHTSPSGNLLRSKSEALIDLFLWQNNIPYRYECELILGDTILYPDFTIRHPISGDTYYWEHFGLIDTPYYSQNALSKLSLYSKYNIFPTINLITTYETKDHPLQSNFILSILNQYFL